MELTEKREKEGKKKRRRCKRASKGRGRESLFLDRGRSQSVESSLLNSCSSLMTMRQLAMLTHYVSITQVGNKLAKHHFQIPELIRVCNFFIIFGLVFFS